MEAGELRLTRADRARVTRAVEAAEAATAGEIVVRIVPKAEGTPREHALREFARLGLERTRDHTGVLLYVAAEDHAIELLGDAGIHAKVGDAFWTGTVERLSAAFRSGRFADGIVDAVGEIGKALAAHFPRREGDTNELPDTPVVS